MDAEGDRTLLLAQLDKHKLKSVPKATPPEKDRAAKAWWWRGRRVRREHTHTYTHTTAQNTTY